MTKEEKDWIDNASYKELLKKWRFAEAGDSFFVGEAGEYYAEKMNQRREEIGNEKHSEISKEIGWER
jgi:hypothetical protein